MITITEIDLNDFQSYAEGEGTIAFKPGLNAIRSIHNSAGKSAVLKAFKVASNPNLLKTKADRLSYIRRNTSYAQVTFTFSDGMVGHVLIFPEDFYYVYGNDEVGLVKTKYPKPEFIERLGIIIDKDTGFIANIRDDDQGKLLIDTNSNTDSNLMKMITEHQDLTRMMENVDNKIDEVNSKYIRINEERDNVRNRLGMCEYIDKTSYENKQEALSLGIPIMTDIINLYRITEELKYSENINRDYEGVMSSIDTGITLTEMINSVTSLNGIEYNEDTYKNNLSMIEVASLVNDIKLTVDELHPIIEDEIYDISINTLDAINTLNSISEVRDIVEYDIIDRSCCVGDILFEALSLVNSIEEVNNVDKEMDNIVDLGDNLTQTILLLKNIYNISSVIDKKSSTIKTLEEKLNIEGKQFDCPIHGKIVYKGKECIPI